MLEQPQVWSMPAAGGRATKLAELRGEIAGAAFSPSGKLAYVGLDDPSFSGSTNLGLWVRDGRTTRRLGEELDRTFFFIVVGDLLDFGALAPVPVIWLDDENVVVPVTDRWWLCPLPVRARRLGRTPRGARRRDLHVARGRRRAARDDRERRRRRVRRVRGRGRRPAPAVTERRQLARPVPLRTRAPRRAPPRRPRARRLARASPGTAQQGSRPADPRRPALRPRPGPVAGDDRARGRRLHGALRQSARIAGLRGVVRESDRRELGRGGRLRSDAARRLGVTPEARDPRPRRPPRPLLRRLHDELVARAPPGTVRGRGQREPRARPLLVLRRVRLRVHDRRARRRSRGAVGRLRRA